MAKTKFADIFEAAKEGTVEDVRYFIKGKDANIDAKDKDGRTPLQLAARNGNIEVVKFLVSEEADVNARDKHGATPLHWVKSVEVAEFLVSKGADVSARDNDGDTPLYNSVGYLGDLTLAGFLISKGADVNARSKEDWTLLTRGVLDAIRKGDFATVHFLVSKGANVNAKGAGLTPLRWAEHVIENLGNNWSPEEINNAKIAKQYFVSVGGKSSGGGCYIATAVYNSYDAPEVLCLRRFRDEVLATSVLGRLFITLYYRLSPPAAERLKRTRHINLLARKALDKIVGRLSERFNQQKEDVKL